ncbi:SgcJ/EcaC family oxidoreductase [Ascidiimonas aurantiaca]|uniref:SgcJ/EcaC family oxidoreductase n=1 Tax=Ascidiimonas aurantiaca TaxID=1685432 RepID=UPI0030EF1A67
MNNPVYPEVNAPENLPDLFIDYWNKRDARGIASLFAKDAGFVNVVGLWWHNRQAIYKAHEYGLRVIFNRSHLELRQKKVRHLTEDVVLIHARMKLSGQTGLGIVAQGAPRFTIFTFVICRTGNAWLCAAAHNTDVVPGKETNLIDPENGIQPADYRQ